MAQYNDIGRDLIEVFKILKGYENIDQEVFFDMSQSSLRGHSLKLNKKRVRLDVAKFSFSNRVVNDILDEEIISGCSLAGFKRKLDRHLRDKRGYISFSFLPLYRQFGWLDSSDASSSSSRHSRSGVPGTRFGQNTCAIVVRSAFSETDYGVLPADQEMNTRRDQ